MMIDLVVGLTLNLAVFAGLGFGPSLWLIRERHRVDSVLMLAPAVGLVLVCVAGTLLTQFGWPVSQWCFPAVISGSVISLALTVSASSQRNDMPDGDRRSWWPLVAFAVTTVLVISPQLIGGLQYSILRGNGTDSFNYLTGAGYLDHESLSWLSKVDAQSLVERHPLYLRSRGLLESRWTTMMLLAFESRIAGVAPIRFEYMFSALCSLLTFGPTFLWCKRGMRLGLILSVVTTAAICAGFWAQFVIDERADSHQNAVPVLMLFACLVLQLDINPERRPAWTEHALLGATTAALLFIYPEIVGLITLGTVVFIAVRFWHGHFAWSRAAGWALTLSVALLMALPLRTMLTHFIAMQFSYASVGVNNWHLAYFRWLYESPLTGLWGFAPFVSTNYLLSQMGRYLLIPIGAVLTVGLSTAIFQGLFRLSIGGFALAASLSAAALLQAAYLYFHGQLWAAGKGVSFGAPFFLLAVIGYVASVTVSPVGGWRNGWRTALSICTATLLSSQLVLAVGRPWLAEQSVDYPGYIVGHGEYRRHDWDLRAIEQALSERRGATVWSYLDNVWMADYVALDIGWDVDLVQLAASRDVSEIGAPRQRLNRPPDFLLLETSGLNLAALPDSTVIIARNRELALVRATGLPVLVDTQNVNGIEDLTGQPFFWLGGPATRLTVVAPSTGCARLAAHFSLGPSLPAAFPRHLRITRPDDPPLSFVVGDGPQTLDFRTTAGLNVLQLSVDESPSLKIPSDPRPLMLRADNVRLDERRCSVE